MTKGKFIFSVDVTNVNECQFSFNLISENEDIHLINQFCACVFAASPVRICWTQPWSSWTSGLTEVSHLKHPHTSLWNSVACVPSIFCVLHRHSSKNTHLIIYFPFLLCDWLFVLFVTVLHYCVYSRYYNPHAFHKDVSSYHIFNKVKWFDFSLWKHLVTLKPQLLFCPWSWN